VQAQTDLNAPDPTKFMAELKAQGVGAFRVVLLHPWKDYLPESHPMFRVYEFAGMQRLVVCPLTNADWLPQLDRLSQTFAAGPAGRDEAQLQAAGGGAEADEHCLIAVGTPVAGRPPHRSQRARFGHWAPTSGV
jgi:hypothetical protein